MNRKSKTPLEWIYQETPKNVSSFGMVDCNPKATQLNVDLNLSLLDCADEKNQQSHRASTEH